MTENIQQQQNPSAQNILVDQQLKGSQQIIKSPQQINIGDSGNQIYVNKNRDAQKEKQAQDKTKEVEEQYNPLKIPADWELAHKHALARWVGKKIHSADQEYCPCCGYEVNRELLSVVGDTDQLAFLGSGFPLFYNFIKHCILILFAYFICKGAYNLYTNLNGNFCNGKNLDLSGHSCQPKFIFQSSLANKLNDPQILEFQSNLDILVLVLVSAILFQFRKSSRVIDRQLEEENITPADYTLMVKNIPKGLNVDYNKELADIFTYQAVPQSDIQIVVTKITLIYNMDEIVNMEDNINELIKKKQDQLIKNKMNFQDVEIVKLDKEIEEADKLIEKKKDDIHLDTQKFAGIALIGFRTESMKDEVLRHNSHTWQDRFMAYLHSGKSCCSLAANELSWMDQKLFLEEAPEPNDIDWEFVHVVTNNKILWRILSMIISCGFILFTFLIIFYIQGQIDDIRTYARELKEYQDVDDHLALKITLLSQAISWLIVLFNKFIIGFTFHKIVDTERISSKTKFNIQFAYKLSIALFINTAVISYIIDIVIEKNVIGEGGFIQNETQVFILNALFPPTVWFLDPYNMLKVYQRNRELAKVKLNQSVVTQQQANFLMEHTEYFQAKRYADIMKTVWFTFLFGAVIPLGNIVSIIGLSLYYWADKYNVMRRRTVNDSLGRGVSIAMIGMLDLSIVFCGIGNMTMNYVFFNSIYWQDVFVLLVGLTIYFSPMQQLNDWIYEIVGIKFYIFKDHPKLLTYEKAQYQFVTDYDRENPITRRLALEAWTKHKHLFPDE